MVRTMNVYIKSAFESGVKEIATSKIVTAKRIQNTFQISLVDNEPCSCSWVCWISDMRTVVLLLDKVEEREDEYPDKVDEVPVQSDLLH